MPAFSPDLLPIQRHHRAGRIAARVARGLCAALVAFLLIHWLFSHYERRALHVNVGDLTTRLAWSEGRVWFIYLSPELTAPPAHLRVTAPKLNVHFRDPRISTYNYTDLLEMYDRQKVPEARSFLGLVWDSEYVNGRGTALLARYCAVPHWLLIAMTVGLYALCSRYLLCHMRIRQRRGMCPNCGYDLRATSDRCPECGIAVPEGHKPEVTPTPAFPTQEE